MTRPKQTLQEQMEELREAWLTLLRTLARDRHFHLYLGIVYLTVAACCIVWWLTA